jgi:hypothetical protein
MDSFAETQMQAEALSAYSPPPSPAVSCARARPRPTRRTGGAPGPRGRLLTTAVRVCFRCAAMTTLLDSGRFVPPGKRLPDLPLCPQGVGAPPAVRKTDDTSEHSTTGANEQQQCLYRNDDGTFSRTHSSDHLVRQENLHEYPPLARALGAAGVKTVVDAGANDGLSTRLFALGLPHARVIALEPGLGNYALLLRNTRELQPRVSVCVAGSRFLHLWVATSHCHPARCFLG